MKNESKKSRFRNYVPHNEVVHRETRRSEEDWEDWLWKLSTTVGKACDKWLASRGIKSNQFAESQRYNSTIKRPIREESEKASRSDKSEKQDEVSKSDL